MNGVPAQAYEELFQLFDDTDHYAYTCRMAKDRAS
jgi:hypothetical protein